MKEIWRDIKGYENLYQISNFGRVRSLDRELYRVGSSKVNNGQPKMWRYKGKILKPVNAGKWKYKYLTVRLYKDTKRRQIRISKLIREHFNEHELPEGHEAAELLKQSLYLM